MQMTHSFSYNNYVVTLTTIDKNKIFKIYDKNKCTHTGVLTEVDVMTDHKITCAIAYKKYVVNLPNITFDLYDGTVLTIQCK